MRSSDHVDFCHALKVLSSVICIILYLLNKLNFFYRYEIIRWYLNDIICGYIFSLVVSELYRFFLKREISMRNLFLLLILASIFWEFIYPFIDFRSTKDYFDILAYFIGYILYYTVFNITYSQKG